MNTNSVSSKFIVGAVVLAVGVILVITGLNWYNTICGTALLFESKSFSNLYNFYFVPLVVGALVASVGLWLVKNSPSPFANRKQKAYGAYGYNGAQNADANAQAWAQYNQQMAAYNAQVAQMQAASQQSVQVQEPVAQAQAAPAAKFCTMCGARNELTMKFCTSCGNKFDE